MREHALVGCGAARGSRREQRRLEPAAVLVAALRVPAPIDCDSLCLGFRVIDLLSLVLVFALSSALVSSLRAFPCITTEATLVKIQGHDRTGPQA